MLKIYWRHRAAAHIAITVVKHTLNTGRVKEVDEYALSLDRCPLAGSARPKKIHYKFRIS